MSAFVHVAVKRSRLAAPTKYWHGILNVRKHYYVRRAATNKPEEGKHLALTTEILNAN